MQMWITADAADWWAPRLRTLSLYQTSGAGISAFLRFQQPGAGKFEKSLLRQPRKLMTITFWIGPVPITLTPAIDLVASVEVKEVSVARTC
jgi:hypothetical protein